MHYYESRGFRFESHRWQKLRFALFHAKLIFIIGNHNLFAYYLLLGFLRQEETYCYCRYYEGSSVRRKPIVIVGIIIILVPLKSMAAPRTVWALFLKFGTLDRKSVVYGK